MRPSLLELVFLVLQLVLLSLEEFAKIFFDKRWVAFVHGFFDESLEKLIVKKYLPYANRLPKK